MAWPKVDRPTPAVYNETHYDVTNASYAYDDDNADGGDYPEYESFPKIAPTTLRTNEDYSTYYVNLTRFLLTGAGPILLLSFFYYRVSDEKKLRLRNSRILSKHLCKNARYIGLRLF